MKKIVWIVLIVLVLVAVELGGSYYVGNFAEQRYRQAVELINETPGLSVEILSYQRGWFKSKFETQIKTLNNTLTLKSTLLHGPIIIDTQLSPFVQFALAVQKGEFDNQNSMLGIPGIVYWSMRFPFTGGISFAVNGDQADYQHASVFVSSQAWRGGGSITGDFKAYNYDALYPQVIVREKKEVPNGPQIRFSGVRTDASYQHIDENKRQFQGTYSVDEIAGEGGIPGLISGLVISNEIKVLAQTIEIGLDTKIKNFNFLTQQYGPGHLDLQLVNLDKPAVKAWWVAFVASKNSNPDQTAQNSTQMMTAFKDILVKKPKLMVEELSFTLPEGAVWGKGNMTLGGPEITDPTDTDKLMQTIEGNIDVVLPKTVLRTLAKQRARQSLFQNPQAKTLDPQQMLAAVEQGADQFIADLTKNEILREKDANNYEIQIAFSKGRWMAGGHEVTIPQAQATLPANPPAPSTPQAPGAAATPAPTVPLPAPATPSAPGASGVPAAPVTPPPSPPPAPGVVPAVPPVPSTPSPAPPTPSKKAATATMPKPTTPPPTGPATQQPTGASASTEGTMVAPAQPQPKNSQKTQ